MPPKSEICFSLSPALLVTLLEIPESQLVFWCLLISSTFLFTRHKSHFSTTYYVYLPNSNFYALGFSKATSLYPGSRVHVTLVSYGLGYGYGFSMRSMSRNPHYKLFMGRVSTNGITSGKVIPMKNMLLWWCIQYMPESAPNLSRRHCRAAFHRLFHNKDTKSFL